MFSLGHRVKWGGTATLRAPDSVRISGIDEGCGRLGVFASLTSGLEAVGVGCSLEPRVAPFGASSGGKIALAAKREPGPRPPDGIWMSQVDATITQVWPDGYTLSGVDAIRSLFHQ
jgi:hypothetical protein